MAVLVVWLGLSLVVALVIGRGIRLADQRAHAIPSSRLTTAELPAGFVSERVAHRR